MPLAHDLLSAHLATVTRLLPQAAAIEAAGAILVRQLAAGHKVMLCGNGGSAADAQHLAAELVCRFEGTRRGLPAIALTTDTSALTAIGNDFGFAHLFARQVEALARPGDVLVALSTSGASANVLAAVAAARAQGAISIGLTGEHGGALKTCADHVLCMPASVTARIQECHILVGHIWCAQVDQAFA